MGCPTVPQQTRKVGKNETLLTSPQQYTQLQAIQFTRICFTTFWKTKKQKTKSITLISRIWNVPPLQRLLFNTVSFSPPSSGVLKQRFRREGAGKGSSCRQTLRWSSLNIKLESCLEERGLTRPIPWPSCFFSGADEGHAVSGYDASVHWSRQLLNRRMWPTLYPAESSFSKRGSSTKHRQHSQPTPTLLGRGCVRV